MAIEVGDTIYILHEHGDWTLTQRTMVVTQLTSRPNYGKNRKRSKAYKGVSPTGKPDSTLHSFPMWNDAKRQRVNRPIVRKTPYPDVPFEERGG